MAQLKLRFLTPLLGVVGDVAVVGGHIQVVACDDYIHFQSMWKATEGGSLGWPFTSKVTNTDRILLKRRLIVGCGAEQDAPALYLHLSMFLS